MDHPWHQDACLREIAQAVAKELGTCPQRLFRQLLFQHLSQEPGLTILPALRGIDQNGRRGLCGPPLMP